MRGAMVGIEALRHSALLNRYIVPPDLDDDHLALIERLQRA